MDDRRAEESAQAERTAQDVRRRSIAVLILCQVAVLSVWFSSAAVLGEMGGEAGLGPARLAWLSTAVQAGFAAGALVYDGVEKFGGIGQAFRGQTGSQSSIVPSMDALFGVVHSNDPLRAFLDELHQYRPVPHRKFIDDLRAQSTLRAFATASGDAALKDAFNANLTHVANFRTRHLEYAASYINKQASSGAGNDPDVGTGGTPFMKYLKKHRDENRAQLLENLIA